MNRSGARRAWARWTLLILAMGCLAGCRALAGWMAAMTAQPVKVQALYKAPKGKHVLVFVDDYFHLLTYEPLKGMLTARLNRQLGEHKIAAKTIDYNRVVELRGAQEHFQELSISEVGQKLGAEIVLYVLIDRFSLRDSEAADLWRGRIQTTVRIVDVKTGRLWPTDRPEGYAVPPIELPLSDNSSPGYESELAQTLAERAADQIAKLFYDHKITQEEEQKTPPPPPVE